MNRCQCSQAGCGAVWDSMEQMRAIDASSIEGELHDLSLAPKCPRCGAQTPHVRPNLRGGDWFRHAPYLETQQRLLAWLDECVDRHLSVAVVEVGVGPNTPIVTRIPTCAFASAVAAGGGRATYLRLNPNPPQGRVRIPTR